jgi:demethylmenaquinone methyltransferase/2-methoxy-6-polyprenyl-1,4-benzoquinol methylase
VEKDRDETVRQMFNDISPTYDTINRIVSLGIDKSWRRQLLKQLPTASPLQLLDIATGTADQLIAFLQNCPQITKAYGIDVAEEMLKIGQQKLATNKLTERSELLCASALALPFNDQSFDCTSITFGIRNIGNPLVALQEMHRVLKPKGQALILEFSLPSHPLVKRSYLLYLRYILPKIAGLVSGHTAAYVYLNQTIEKFPYGQTFCNLIAQAGFATATALPLTFGIATLYIGTK